MSIVQRTFIDRVVAVDHPPNEPPMSCGGRGSAAAAQSREVNIRPGSKPHQQRAPASSICMSGGVERLVPNDTVRRGALPG